MIYTRKTPALFIIGLVMLGIWWLTTSGMMAPVLNHLGTAEKYAGEITTLALYFGVVSFVLGLWAWLGKHKEGNVDYFLGTVAGGMFILIITMLVRWFLAPEIAVLGRSFGEVGETGKYIHELLGLNYIVIGIVTGIIIVNVFSVPEWAQHGVRLSRLGLKTGVILLGTLYSLAELKQLGKLSVVLVGVFVLGSVGVVLWLSKLRKVSNSMGGVLSAGIGVCGVSATVAASPVVKAKSVEIAYTIGTILLWGVGCMFVFPIIGHLMGMGYVQFGAWAGTGILNSAQVAGAALAFQPDGIETLKVAEIFNITRVLFLPIIVLWLALWYVKQEQTTQEVSVGRVVIEKFPVFVLGFILMFALSSTGIFAPAQHYQGKYFDNDIAEEDLLSTDQLAILLSQTDKIERDDQKQAFDRLVQNKKIMSIDDDDEIRGLINSGILSEEANSILADAHKHVRHEAAKIRVFRELITWLFAFGLVGLGMQITVSAMRQAGGQPAVIGGIVGLLKAVLSLIVVLLFVEETI
ncbi:MAG: putative sulfate exporter family transporter [Pseudomonadota bacterium]